MIVIDLNRRAAERIGGKNEDTSFMDEEGGLGGARRRARKIQRKRQLGAIFRGSPHWRAIERRFAIAKPDVSLYEPPSLSFLLSRFAR
jgi:hypothetical protein